MQSYCLYYHLPNGDKSSQLLKSEHQGLSDPKVAAGWGLSLGSGDGAQAAQV